MPFAIGDRPSRDERRKPSPGRPRHSRHDRMIFIIAGVCVALLVLELIAAYRLQRP